ncbi:hypothetical protein CERSUDRAFT_117232 [Gelatoporia subvermispora B]|uniref:Zn(2)-C6 fungal-type domain-containing protein n=1 Tax=Ceriporiopsis subvermispora (strain B) TaxID=914234 RepID=M2PEQ1_CERS8|nr:hypothetical protein CERSUDRAFT_117232 [Gelatoporia subvermispora B]
MKDLKSASPLQRGMACLSCRKRKQKCDGVRPVCTQCTKSSRTTTCQYVEKKQTSRTELLQQKVAKLEARLRELEAEQGEIPLECTPVASSSNSPGETLGNIPLHSDNYASSSTSILLSDAWEQSLFSSHASGSSAGSSSSSVFDPSSHQPSWPNDFLNAPLPTDEFLNNLALSAAPVAQVHGSTTWWEDPHTFCDNKQMLLDIFFMHKHQCCFDVHQGRFQASLYLQSSDRPHPALLDAMYLLACYFSRSPRLSELQPHFLRRALQGISDALQLSDRIINVLQASCLLGVYFYCHGRVLEGYYHSSIAARLAVGMGLHQVRSEDWFQLQMALAGYAPDLSASVKASLPSTPPMDAIDYAERVAAFWQVFMVDRAWTVATGLPSALPDDDNPRAQIQTVWPTPISSEPSTVMDGGALHSLYKGGPPAQPSATSPVTLRAKAVVLYERTFRMSTMVSKGNVRWDEFRSLELSIAQFTTNLPYVSRQSRQGSPSNNEVDFVNIYALIFASSIHLHRGLADSNPASYEKCLVAANSMTSSVRDLSDGDYDFLDPIISNCWRTAADVYIRMLASPQTQTLQCALDVINQELDVLILAMNRLGLLFPVAGIHASKTEQDRIAASSLSISAVS